MKSFFALLLVCAASVFGHDWKWSDCSDPKTRVMEIITFDVSPKPLQIPGNATVTIVGKVANQLATNSHYRLKVRSERKSPFPGLWIPFPCVKKWFPIGSCIYEDPYACKFLQMLPLPNHHACPVELGNNHFSSCPIDHEFFHARVTVFSLKDMDEGVKFLLSGDYRARVELLEDTKMIGCLTMEFSLNSKSSLFPFFVTNN